MSNPVKKIVFVGSSDVGKGSMIETFCGRRFPETKISSIFETWTRTIDYHGKPLDLSLCYTQGSEDFNRLRPLSYPGADVMVITFAIDSPGSLDDVEDIWASEALHWCPNAPLVLVGLKKDTRNDPETLTRLARDNKKPVSFEQGEAMSRRIQAFYGECSSRDMDAVDDVFMQIVAASFLPRFGGKKRRRWCCVQ